MNAPLKPPSDMFPWIYWSIFLILVPLVALGMAGKSTSQVDVPVPVRELPPYHVIAAGDVISKSVNLNSVASDTVRSPQNLIGYYTREIIQEGKPFREDEIGAIADPRLISNTLAVAIPATSATILGGKLRAGDVVSLATVPISDTSTAPTIVFDAVLVLDVKTNDKGTVIVFAIPANRWLEYLAKTRNATIMLARRVE